MLVSRDRAQMGRAVIAGWGLVIALLVPAAPVAAQGAQAPPQDYTQADVHFMQGMIMHHAQAVVMSDWAATHDARPALQVLARRIALSQRDEIDLMQRWLRARKLDAPDPLHTSRHDTGAVHDTSPMHMPGMDMGAHPMLMNGMLTAEEMRQLDAARGTAFDSLYLTGMIRHHQGALDMVATLFATPGAGQQPEISTLATDIDAGQRAEIGRMEAMLNTLTPGQAQ
ncbi:MAG TPA: DUF305 domain-containing protein [Gemmatimonadaceae bacterium]|nr:DUF305 domain-containing protein [Gemmatimonadaceae bacterium]